MADARAAAASLALLLPVALAAGEAHGQAGAVCPEPVARLTSAEGDVRVNGRPPTGQLPGSPICPGDTVEVGSDSRAAVYLGEADTPLQLDEGTVSRFPTAEPGSGFVELARGAIYFLSEVRRTLTISTPYVTAGVEGTEVYLDAGGRPGAAGGGAELLVLEGRVAVTPGERTLGLAVQVASTGERVEVGPGGEVRRSPLPGDGGPFAALRRVAVGELSWTLFYPDVLVADEAAAFPRIGDAARLLAAGQVDEAEAALAAVPGDAGPEAALRDALRSTVAFARKDAAEALRLAERARAADPRAGTPLVALSYARQLALDLDGATAVADAAADAAPRSPLPQARLAELRLMQGQTRVARRAAREAQALGGGSLADIALGYAELAALRGRAAEAAFRRALAAESRNPLGLLGLGLAQIKQGDLEEGRRQIESAVAHDPSSSLLRSYLGKGYFEERRDEPAAKQFAIAKELDQRDPTPWFYDAIRKQLANRPVEALRDLERSIELNDNRAPFRSRLLLDEDAATRSTSAGRIYEDLGFRQLGLNRAAGALALDPSSAAAHRFLSDLYQGVPRLETARASELLQAQLLQNPNLQPVQPSLSFTDLDLVADSGPSRVGFGEYGHLFVRDGVRLDTAGVLGSHHTIAGETAVSALAGRTALSAGAFHYESDGFRRNFDLEHDIQNLFAQTLLGNNLNVQAEYRRRDTHSGDRRLLFDLEDFERSLRRDIEEEVYRLGSRLEMFPGIDIIFSYIHANRDERSDFDFVPETRQLEQQGSDTDQFEAQLIARLDERSRLVLGAGRTVRDSDIRRDFRVGTQLFPSLGPSDIESRSSEVYAVATTAPMPSLEFSARLGWDDVETRDERGTKEQFGMAGVTPGLGVRWMPSNGTTLRAAVSRTTKRPFAAEQTLRPTNLAGFNQLYDEFDGTRSDQIDLAIEQRVLAGLTLGAAATVRRLARERSDDLGENVDLTDAEDDRLLSFAYWAPTSRLAVAFEPSLERYRARRDEVDGDPVRILTYTAPLTGTWFHPTGWFATARATALQQEVEGLREGQSSRRDDWGILLDAGAGYRLPFRRGVIGVRVDNILDQDLSFQDESLRTTTDLNPRFIPSRTVLLTATLNF